jgi:hypothetical protein
VSSNIRLVLVTIGVVLLPFVLWALYSIDPLVPLLWFFVHQIYYMPFSILGAPFFRSDSEVGFWVLPLGRLLAGVCYALIVITIFTIVRQRHRKG